MGRILAIDYGTKRSGIAVTDPLKILAQPLTGLDTAELLQWLKTYTAKESVELIVLGLPLKLNGEETDNTRHVRGFFQVLRKNLPGIPVAWQEEYNTSAEAMQALIQSGKKKQQRSDKKLLDTVSAALILQRYLEDHP